MWAVNMYSDWRHNRMSQGYVLKEIIDANLAVLNTFSEHDLCFALSRFIREVKKIDGGEYPSNTIWEIIVMIQMYLHENSIYWKLFDDQKFLGLHNVVDNTMKERHSMGLGVRKSSDVISINHEIRLFNQGILANEHAFQLLCTMIYMVGLHCALRGGTKHNVLRQPGCNLQFSVEFDDVGRKRLVFIEDPLQKK